MAEYGVTSLTLSLLHKSSRIGAHLPKCIHLQSHRVESVTFLFLYNFKGLDNDVFLEHKIYFIIGL